MSFFDTTTVGTIINRTVVDRENIDYQQAYFGQFVYFAILQLVSILFLIGISSGFMFIVFVVGLGIFFKRVAGLLLLVNEFRKLTQIALGPMTSNIVECVNGIASLQAFDSIPYQFQKFRSNAHKYHVAFYHEQFANFYLIWKGEMVAILFFLATTMSIAAIKVLDIKFLLNVQTVSLTLTGIIQLSSWMTYNLYSITMMINGLASLERIFNWIDNTDVEDKFVKPNDPINSAGHEQNVWPDKGAIKARNIVMRYRPGLPRVLNGINFDVLPRQKVGIVGRTGSGKSSLILAILRIVEQDIDPNDAEAKKNSYFEIDGRKLHELGLRTARQAMSLIPQDPFLISGTVRSNIDPFDKHSDEKVLQTLHETAVYEILKSTIERSELGEDSDKKLPGGQKLTSSEQTKKSTAQVQPLSIDKQILNFKIEESGSNLSQGQRQLICISRALINHPKILLMDEATSNIDTKTDALIQKLIREKFQNSTVMTIAHRLNTIIDYDKILFLKEGKIAEDDHPYTLMCKDSLDPDSYFRSLIMEGGQEFFDQMLARAKESYDHLSSK